MSRGFVKEDDQEEAPFVPPRAPLPDGLPNYVTPRGLALLHTERAALEADVRATLADPTLSDHDRRRRTAELDGRLALLHERIVTARVVEPAASAEVRFGSVVRLTQQGAHRKAVELAFAIVGVDEANVKEGRIAFTAPLAKALMGKRAGEQARLLLGSEWRELRIISVA